MGNVFGEPTPLKEVVKGHQRTIKKAIRELDRVEAKEEIAQKKLIADIKKNAKENRNDAVKVGAKSLVRSRKAQERVGRMKLNLSSLSTQLLTVSTNENLVTTMKGVTKALKSMNKLTSATELQKIMHEFARENERAEMTQETVGDAIDDAMADDDDEEEEESIVSAVLDELGIKAASEVPMAPTAAAATPAGAEAATAPAGGGAADTGMDELEARLNNLRRS